MMENVFGVDVAKNWIDVVGPDGHARIVNADLDRFTRNVAAVGGRVAFEASGGYETPLRDALGAAGVPAHRVNPRQARAFATSLGRLAKTDRADAAVLREMGLRLDLPICPPETEELKQLKALQLRRRQLAADAAREKTRLKQTADKAMRASLERVLRFLSKEVTSIEAEIATLIEGSQDLRAKADLLRSAPGVGPVSATAILAELPELGTLSPAQVAALAGVAPMARESGMRSAKRRIRGGRKSLRDVLYMAGLSASRHDPGLKAFADRLKANGKAPKQAIIAVTRKLLIILNAMVRENRHYEQS